MSRNYKPDPYDGFKCDRERRKALGTREWCRSLVVLGAVAMSGEARHVKEVLEWITKLFR